MHRSRDLRQKQLMKENSMSTFGKTIRLFLLEGTTNSLVSAELSNWTGVGIKVPRIKVKEYDARAEFQKAGVYILFGKDDNNHDAAYIGEAEIISDRLKSHIANKEFWNEVIFFTSKDKYLNKASVKYLEHRMHDIAVKADRVKMQNQNTPTKSELSESEQAELEEFLANIKILTATLGQRIFETVEETIAEKSQRAESNTIKIVEGDISEGLLFFCQNNNGSYAMGTPSTEGFMVFKNALLLKDGMISMNESIRQEKAKMVEDGTLVEENGLLKLTKNYNFTSSSRAACMILGRSANGRMEWKTEAGTPLKQFD